MKNNLIKKFVLYAFVIIYDVVSLLWCYIILSNFVYNLTEIQRRGPSITIIGGADFGSVAKIKKASIEEICKVKGIKQNTAQKIVEYFNK